MEARHRRRPRDLQAGEYWACPLVLRCRAAAQVHTAELFGSSKLALAPTNAVTLVSASALADFYVGCRHGGHVPTGLIDRAEFNQLLKLG